MNKYYFCIATIVAIFFFCECSSDDDIIKPDYNGLIKHYKIEATPDSIMSGDAHDLILDVSTDSPDLNTWHLFNCRVADFSNHSFQDNPSFENIIWDGSGPDSDVSLKNDTIIIDDWLKVYKIWSQGKYKLKVEMKANHSETMRGAQIIIGYEYRNSTLSGEVTILQDYIKSEEQALEVKFRYKGKLYSSQATLDADSSLVYADESIGRLQDSISSLPGIKAIVFEDNTIDYYDPKDQAATQQVKRAMQRTISTLQNGNRVKRKSYHNPLRYLDRNSKGGFAIFDDNNFHDTDFHYNLYDYFGAYDNTRIETLGLNDKVSSLAVSYLGDEENVVAVLTVWEDCSYNYGDDNRSKHRISFVATYRNRHICPDNLKALPLNGSRKTWNDRISSLSFHFGNIDRVLIDY